MWSGSSQLSDYSDDTEPDVSIAIPDFARTWESASQVASSVRRPSTPPNSQSYHQIIEPQAIFELDERQKDGSIETILVVPMGCERCKLLKQACSRTRPACTRCRKAGLSCEYVQGGYQRLPGPKVERPRKQNGTSGACNKSTTSPSTQDSIARHSRVRRTPSRVESLSQVSLSRPSVVSGSKRPLSPESAPFPPRKKAQAKSTSQKRARCFTAPPPKEMDVECSETSAVASSAQVVPAMASASKHSSLKWTFVNRDEKSSLRPEDAHSTTMIPRVWTNSLGALLTVFSELAKSTAGLSWFQSETPILLLDTNYARGQWINSNALKIDLLWDFSCHESELEAIVESDTEGPIQRPSCQSVAYFPGNTPNYEAETMGLRNPYFPTASAPLPTFTTQVPHSHGIQGERDMCQGSTVSYAGGTSLIHSATQSDSASAARSTQLYDSVPLSPPKNSQLPHPAPDESLITPCQPGPQPRIPLNKPPEVETLLNSHPRFIPLLLWLSRDSGLVPCNLPPEYAYSCIGLFFISDLRHAVVQCDISSTTGLVQGQVCWSVTLQWAPGGEDALFDCSSAPLSNPTSDSVPVDTMRDLSHPWWFDPTVTPSHADDTTPYRPRDLRMQFFSFIPLDLLAEFHPSESFPRGWFCKSCGMINVQVYFRHQICQSTTCKSTHDKRIPPGKVDSLSSLRGLHRSSTLIRPIDNIPSVVVSEDITWDDGMQSWVYSVKDRVTLCHIFTGNQENLQQDATALLERIQYEVLLRKEDSSSPYFTHSTRLSHRSDGSEAMVPGGTPDCVRTAYYTLCDLAHRYGEMDKPRFGEVRLQAWCNPGSKRGDVLYASRFPVVVHCLGADVVLNFTPKRGYSRVAKSTAPDKGKGRAIDEDRTGCLSTEPCAGPSRDLEQDDRIPPISEPEANETPVVAENVDEAMAAMDTQRSSQDADCIALPDSNTYPGMEVAGHEVTQRRVRKKNKVTKDKNKASVPEISMTLVHGDSVVLCGDDFEFQIVRTGTTILVIGLPEEMA